jgi:hypothetical protein
MRIGNLRTKHKTIEGKDKYIVQGKKRGGGWESCYDPAREEMGLDKWLIFDLEYDACGMVVSFAQWFQEYNRENAVRLTKQQREIIKKRIGNRQERRKRKSLANKSKRKNRKKK